MTTKKKSTVLDKPPHEEGCTCEWCDPVTRRELERDALIAKHWGKQQLAEQEATENLFRQDA